jgi:hypothetical protein
MKTSRFVELAFLFLFSLGVVSEESAFVLRPTSDSPHEDGLTGTSTAQLF